MGQQAEGDAAMASGWRAGGSDPTEYGMGGDPMAIR